MSRSRRAPIAIIAVLAVTAAGVVGSTVTHQQNGPAHRAGYVTSMAQLVPQLIAPAGADKVTGAAPQPACTSTQMPLADVATAVPGQTTTINHDGASVQLGTTAVTSAIAITAQSLCASDLAPMDQGLINVTAGPRRGYRFLPHMTFAASLRLTLPYDPTLIPAGMSAQDVKTFYYDTGLHRWQALPVLSINTTAHTITSSTDHFTDFVSGTITVPDHPGVLNYDPTSIKDIKAADPGANINLIDPPQASSDGAAHLSYPVQLPAGRHARRPACRSAMTPARRMAPRRPRTAGWAWAGT